MSRRLTERQYDRLRILGSGAIVLAPGRRDWGPLLRRGWVVGIRDDDGESRFLPPLQITADGLRALAVAVERFGLPSLKPDAVPAQCNEPPFLRKLRLDLDDARHERDEARRAERRAANKLARITRVIDGQAA